MSDSAAVPSSRENAKETGPIQLCGVFEEREQLVVVPFRLAGKADDERRTERGVGLVAPDAIDDVEEAVTVAPSASSRATAVPTRCSERSKYGTTDGSSSIVETNGSCTSDGYK